MPLKLVRRKGSKTWYVSGSIRGERYFESARTGSKPHAEAFRVGREREILDGTYYGEGHASIFGSAVLVYLEKGGEGRFLAPIIDRFGKMKLGEITPGAVSTFAREHYGHLAPATVKRTLYTPLNAVMRAAHKAQLGPLYRFDPPKVKRAPVKYADDRWLEQFFAAAHFRIAATVLFMTLTGARVSEACRLAPADVDSARGEAVLRLTKNGRSRRVPLAPILVTALERAVVELAKEIDGSARVFGYADRWSVNQAIERVCVKAGIAVMSSHKVGRHAFAARLLGQGKSLKLVQEAGGWAQINVVSESYGHLEQQAIDDAVRGAADNMPALPAPKLKKE